MLELDKKYLTKLKDIKVGIQHSELLKAYLEEEEIDLYSPLKEKFEPQIEAVYNDIAAKHPLQLVSAEIELMDSDYEGLFLPRILGYSVMRGQLTQKVKYVKPLEHFKTVLLVICNSANFDIVHLRSGKTIEIGFALSSDIWITNLLNDIPNKKVRQYLNGLKLMKYRDEKVRLRSYRAYKKQFANFNYLTSFQPQNCSDLTLNGASIIEFLIFRSKSNYDNKSLAPFISDILSADLTECDGYSKLLMVVGMYFDLNDDNKKIFKEQWDKVKQTPDFEAKVFKVLNALQETDHELGSSAVDRLHAVLGGVEKDEFINFLELMVGIESEGYINDNATEKIRAYYNNHKGLSLQNDATRMYIFNKFKIFIDKLATSDFQEYFEFNPVFINYMKIFSNEKFNQDLKAVLLKYVRTLLRTNTDKRSKDYQDIKKFVQPSFVDMGFMNEKSVKELFKTKRKPRSSTDN
ncbi:MAG: hypothetical protein V3V00_09785 [Saprospiraceae bacterium]